ncbi:hypothetical protein ACM39_02050 [Chryseobacterium sp. FH2]|uniref:hypothetical protein n=1 Tax=Chryseobacterium sp. FH2 TaxID=1674291 RepID=UPI00065AB556|nr:hypothetical protein [Chryseobacterium sp. FH2]KMQ69846.1 hypothetical protein ACM39_02050 [Chryseobacterium sp. FH2]
MKSLYIITFLALSLNIYAQENKKVSEAQVQEDLSFKQSKEFETKMLKEAKDRAEKKTTPTTLVSDQGLEVKKQEPKTQVSTSNSGKLLENTATLEEIKSTIPNRQAANHTVNSRNTNNIQGLPNTATLDEIKKTIPKN